MPETHNPAAPSPAELFDVAGKSTLITGANGTLGRTAALALAASGARLTLAGEDAAVLDELAGSAEKFGAQSVQTLVLRPDTDKRTDKMVAAAIAAFGSLDIVVVASGTNRVVAIDEADPQDWDAVIEANATGPWLICRSAGRQMIAQAKTQAGDRAGGKIVLISSTRGRHGHAGGYTAYCASKSAVDGLVRALACEWGPHRINVNAIGPTVFRSELTAWMFEAEGPGRAVREGMLQRIPLGRLGEPGDLVGALMFLVSSASDFCTGQTLYVDGGYTAG
ncbi:MAG: SDR family oxidoreductase [Alphaproteobacteria bacterium]|nr:SDR family oxidoreductase [Alphaproteobacteria bacterium]